MAKAAARFLKVDPWKIIEEGFHPESNRVAESVFSLGNEYMGVRGNFDEGYGGETLQGSYLNGVFEVAPVSQVVAFKGLATSTHFMVNTDNWLHTRIAVDGEVLDLHSSQFRDFTRVLDMTEGTLTRQFVWETASGKSLQLTFERFVSMSAPNLAVQRVSLESLDFDGTASIVSGLDFNTRHWENTVDCWPTVETRRQGDTTAMLGRTAASGHRLFTSFRLCASEGISTSPVDGTAVGNDALPARYAGSRFTINLERGKKAWFEKIVVRRAEKDIAVSDADVWSGGWAAAASQDAATYDSAMIPHRAYWENAWQNGDVVIEGDPENQQGVRFCVFQLHQTYHGGDPSLNVGAKGLTGENYNGATFWDTETYCLPFYLFNNPQAAKNLLLYRYVTMTRALERAVVQDCRGACYPFVTIDGPEDCGVWQHGNLEIHVSSAVAYAIWNYMHMIDDREFLYREGIEVLLQVSRYLASRGDWNSRTGEFGFFGVMGPDEFHMMVNNNCYTNVLGKKTFRYTLSVVDEMQRKAPELLAAVSSKVGLGESELSDWRRMADKMRIPLDRTTGIFEQHDGYFDLPSVDLTKLDQFPIYEFWAYDRIFRYNMIKQPDVLLLFLFFSQDYNLETKQVNYDYYEPRTIHESSLSPGIHSILAAELGMHEAARQFAHFATRLDLDDYNRNSHEGLHTTSMAAAWMNIVFGYGGMRSDGPTLVFNPSLPFGWESFRFKLLCQGAVLNVAVDGETVTLRYSGGSPLPVKVYGSPYDIGSEPVNIALPTERRGTEPTAKKDLTN